MGPPKKKHPGIGLMSLFPIIPKDPFVCPKKGIGPPTFLFFSDGIGTRKILFDREGSGLEMVIPPLMTESLFHGYIGAPTIGLMRLSPIIWNYWEFRPDRTYGKIMGVFFDPIATKVPWGTFRGLRVG